MRRVSVPIAAIVLMASAATVRAQRPAPPAAPTPVPADAKPSSTQLPPPLAVACTGQPIRSVVTRAEYPLTGEWLARVPKLEAAQRWLHTPTRNSVLRSFLLLKEGDTCNEELRAESERLLRAQPFIAMATVVATDAGDGGVILDVAVIDEVSVVLGIDVNTKSPFVHDFRGGSANLLGSGSYLAGEWRDGLAYRDEWSIQAASYVLMGQPIQMSFTGARRMMGGDWAFGVAYPFQTDYQRSAWKLTIGQSDTYIPLVRPDTDAVSIGLRRAYVELGAITRLGSPGSLFLLGVALTGEIETPSTQPMLLRATGPLPDTTAATIATFNNRYSTSDSRRINFMAGYRRVRFLRVTGFDVLEGTQDVRQGFEGGAVVGRGMTEFGAAERDVLLATTLYGGVGDTYRFATLDAQWQGRYRDAAVGWDDMTWSARAQYHWRLRLDRTVIASVEWSGGSREHVPFQLALGEGSGGVRGLGNSRAAGAERVVARIEDRWYLGRLFRVAAVGLAPFADVGVLRAGDVPFGANTDPAVSVGVSLLGAVPPPSRRLFRLDVIYRVTPDRFASQWTFAVSLRDVARVVFQEPADITRSRSRSIPASVFNYP